MEVLSEVCSGTHWKVNPAVLSAAGLGLDSNAENLLLQWDQKQLFSFSTKCISNFKHFHPHDARKLNICIDL